MNRVLVLHGPNLNLLGEREPDIYGKRTLEEINSEIKKYASPHNIECSFFQSNHEGALIDTIHEFRNKISGLIINPAGLTHTSVSLRDALSALECPVIEVHLSNIHAREKFRRSSYISSVSTGVICGFGIHSYILAMDALIGLLQQ
ncbi:type II 3-dehydroquinate dehydratase [candidate division KSB1 bacterium]